MSDKTDELIDTNMKSNPDLQRKALELLQNQAHKTLEKYLDLDERLSRLNLQTNGAAAIAILAFVGSGLAPGKIHYPLAIFVLGVIASGFQVRSQMNHYLSFLNRLSKQRKKIREHQFQIGDVDAKAKGEMLYDHAHRAMGWLSQFCFISGVVVSSWVIWRY